MHLIRTKNLFNIKNKFCVAGATVKFSFCLHVYSVLSVAPAAVEDRAHFDVKILTVKISQWTTCWPVSDCGWTLFFGPFVPLCTPELRFVLREWMDGWKNYKANEGVNNICDNLNNIVDVIRTPTQLHGVLLEKLTFPILTKKFHILWNPKVRYRIHKSLSEFLPLKTFLSLSQASFTAQNKPRLVVAKC